MYTVLCNLQGILFTILCKKSLFMAITSSCLVHYCWFDMLEFVANVLVAVEDEQHIFTECL